MERVDGEVLGVPGTARHPQFMANGQEGPEGGCVPFTPQPRAPAGAPSRPPSSPGLNPSQGKQGGGPFADPAGAERSPQRVVTCL